MWPRGLVGLSLVAGWTTVQAKVLTGPKVLIGEDWLGIDGNWSTIQLWVGSHATEDRGTYLLPSTVLSETLVVGSNGCNAAEQLCHKYRGNPLDVFSSTTWRTLGRWDLGMSSFGVSTYGDYGLDTISTIDTVTADMIAVEDSLVAAYNATDFYTGLFGLGITASRFSGRQVDSPFSQMVQRYGYIPSYSYGFTAGAFYKNSGTPTSLVLGGFDKRRFVPNDATFTLQRPEMVPKTLVRGIEVSVADGAPFGTPANWQSNPQALSRMNESFEAVIDTTTPYLWLPEAVCESIYQSLNLTYNKTLDAYVMDNSQYERFRLPDSYEFKFSLSSYDNTNDFGKPLDVKGVVNITISAQAFGHVLQYPYKQGTIAYKEAAVPYFPLKRSPNNTFVLGRVFMQEAYLITKYDSDVFHLHQALFPEDHTDIDIEGIPQPSGSRYPAPLLVTPDSGLTKSQMAGIVVAAVIVCVGSFASWLLYRRRRQKARELKAALVDRDGKDSEETSIPESPPRTPVSRIFSKIIRKKRSRKDDISGTDARGTNTNPAEVANHELYELPAPLGPVELDADTHSLNGDTELGTEGSENISAYEIARRKLERQLQGPLPVYTPPLNGPPPAVDGSSSSEKSMQDVSPVETYRPSEPSPTSPRSIASSRPFPSPVSPNADWAERAGDLPSPMTAVYPFPSPVFGGDSVGSLGSGSHPTSSRGALTLDPSSMTRASSSLRLSPSGTSLSSPTVPPSPIFQRTPIDHSRVICLGPLPENVQFPTPASIPRSPTAVSPTFSERSSAGRQRRLGSNEAARLSTDTLGSNFTEVEGQLADSISPTGSVGSGPQSARPDEPGHGRERSSDPTTSSPHTLESPRSQERIDAGSELVHVPQLAERRYSWEEEQ